MSRICTTNGVWCEQPVDAAGLLVDADDYFRAFYDAAKSAKRSILLSGWQFDSDVELLRGPDAEGAELPVTLKAFLNALCARTPSLRINILAWDFHMVFALERQWMQEIVFDWTTHENLNFQFDSSHVDRGCHHQKFAVIDGTLSFLGGLDLCDHRWDQRSHLDEQPLRMSRAEPHKPFHDVQTYLVGRDVGRTLEELFTCRWEVAGAEPFELATDVPPRTGAYEPRGAICLLAESVALSRTDPRGSPTVAKGDTPKACHEILDMYVEAIRCAEESIYIETQYFSSRDIAAALVERLRAPGRSALEVVLVLNMKAETLKEEIAVGLAQAKVISDLREAAEGTAHRLGIYYTVPGAPEGVEPKRATYIHSKVMIVDDRFLNVGSANLTNRSCSVDTELNATFECESKTDALGGCIAAVRLNLLAEHLGAPEGPISFEEGRVAKLDLHAKKLNGRLRLHPSPTAGERKVLVVVDPQALPFDPHGTEDDAEDRSIFTSGLGVLWRKLVSGSDDSK